MKSVGLAALIGLIPLLLTVPLLAQVLPTEEPPLIFDKSLQELEREGDITIQEILQLRQGVYPQRSAPGLRYVPNLDKLCSAGVLNQRECARAKGIASVDKKVQVPVQTRTPVIVNSEIPTLWARVRYDITVEQLADQLDISTGRLAVLNDCDHSYKFKAGEWFALPSRSAALLKSVAAIDDSELRRSAPQKSIFARFGDNLARIADRYEIPVHELTRLNPGLNPISRLAVDTPVKLLQPVQARLPFGITPGGSSDLSWPDLPDFDVPKSKRKVQGVCSDLATHQAEVDKSPNPSIERLMALQRRKASLDACNIEKAEFVRRIQAERIAEMRRNRLNWKTYGEVQIPWGLWFEPLAGKRVNGFLGSSNSLTTWGRSIESYGPTGAPNGISVSCSTGTFSINTNPNWNRVQSGWTEWAAPARDSNWERIVIDLCSPVVNR